MNRDLFQTTITYKSTGKRKKFIDYDKPYLNLIGPNVDIDKAKETLKRLRNDLKISYKKKPNAKEKKMCKKYWDKER